MNLTPSQQRIFVAVEILIGRGKAPSYEEIGRQCGIRSSATVWKHVRTLIEQGWLARSRINRGLEIVPDAARNHLKWRSCSDGHIICYFQSEKCPACGERERMRKIADFSLTSHGE